jgi:hypothetical protein
MLPKTISGHAVIRTSADPRLTKRYVPGRPIWIRVRRPYAPLFLRLAVLLDQVEPLKVSNTWSFNYRPARLGEGTSDHCGYAIDCWSDGIGMQTWPSRMPKTKAAAISKLLKQFTTADGRYVFGWGITEISPGVDYPITYRQAKNNDPMHFFIAPGITGKDAAEVAKRLRIASDGTVLPA